MDWLCTSCGFRRPERFDKCPNCQVEAKCVYYPEDEPK